MLKVEWLGSRAEDKVRYEREMKEHEAKMEKIKAEKLDEEVREPHRAATRLTTLWLPQSHCPSRRVGAGEGEVASG